MIVGIAMQQPTSVVAHPPIDSDDEGNVEGLQPAVQEPPPTYIQQHQQQQQQQHLATGAITHSENAPMMPNVMNAAGAPPTQVYVSAPLMGQHHGMMGQLESQFGQFGLEQQHDHTIASSQHNSVSENNDTENTEGEEGEEEPIKLFVGQVPKTLNEEDIFPTFDGFGPLKDVSVIRDKHTGVHRGCAFITYWNKEDAERAREALHDQFSFPGAKRAAQVKPAEPSAAPENKLFIGMLSRTAGEQEVRDMFSPFGDIREVYMIRNPDGSSKCAAFLRFVHRDAAIQAIEQLNGVEIMEGAQRPLIVKFADNKHQRQQRYMRNIRRHEMMAMVGPGGYPYPHQGPPMPMGMHPGGGPQYQMPPPGAEAAYAAAYGPPPGPHQHVPPHHTYMYPPPYGHIPYPFQQQQPQQQPQQPMRQDQRASNPRPREGPAGANLFVYHLPHDLTDADLATAFNPFGNVISAKVYVDKFTGESKGFGFVSYDSVVSAEAAIEQMNGFQIGNKRLKVQHKRVHGGNTPNQQQHQSGPPSGNSSVDAPVVR